MRTNLTWRDKPLSVKLGTVAAVAALGLLSSGWMSVAALGDVQERTDQLQVLNGLTRTTLEADMAHDAARADVLQTLSFTSGPQYDEALAALREHGGRTEIVAEQAAARSGTTAPRGD